MKFREWFKPDEHDLYNFPEEAMKEAWSAAVEQAEIIIADKYDEQEPWLEPGEITAILVHEV